MERPQNVGILGMDIYFPSTYVEQKELEMHDGVSEGKYTAGLGQTNMSFCKDNEDVISISLTVFQNLMDKYSILPTQIGRLEVGTESRSDKSKSIKTDLMRLLIASGNHDVEGVDSTNACYGGTAALFNSVAWIESSAWDGRYAVVVCADVAIYSEGPARPTGGCGSVALLIGPNAPLVLSNELRASYMSHAYDFFKPNPMLEYPVVDGRLSISCYLQAIDNCFNSLCSKIRKLSPSSSSFTLSSSPSSPAASSSSYSIDYAAFHSPYNKLVQKSVGRLFLSDLRFLHRTNPSLIDPEVMDMVQKNMDSKLVFEAPLEDTYTNRELEQFLLTVSSKLYREKVETSALLSKQLGNCYTASLYSSLISLISQTIPPELEANKRIMMFSYGSGLTSSMFIIRTQPSSHPLFNISHIKNVTNIQARLAARTKVSPIDYTRVMREREAKFGTRGWRPSSSSPVTMPGTFHLVSVDDMWRREYARVPGSPQSSQSSPLIADAKL